MAPEEFERGATIDERTSVFGLGRAAFVFLSEGQRGEPDAHLWRGPRALSEVVRAAGASILTSASRPSPRFEGLAERMSETRADQAHRLLAGYARQRDDLLARIVGVLEVDQRVRSAWLSGSFGRGEADAWSDFDLHVAVEDDELVGFWAARDALYGQVGRPVLVPPEMSSNAEPGAHFQLVVFDGPLEVDWNIGPLSQARRPATSQILVQRAECDHGATSLSATERLAWLDHQLDVLLGHGAYRREVHRAGAKSACRRPAWPAHRSAAEFVATAGRHERA